MSYPIPNPANPAWKRMRKNAWIRAGKPDFDTFIATWRPSPANHARLLKTKLYRAYIAKRDSN